MSVPSRGPSDEGSETKVGSCGTGGVVLLLLPPPMSRPKSPGDFERGDDVDSIVFRDEISEDFLLESADFFSVDDFDSQNRRFGFEAGRLDVLALFQFSPNPRPIDSPAVSSGAPPASSLLPSGSIGLPRVESVVGLRTAEDEGEGEVGLEKGIGGESESLTAGDGVGASDGGGR